MTEGIFKNTFSRKEIEGKFMDWANNTLDPPKMVRDRENKKIRLYRKPDYNIDNAIDLKFIWQKAYADDEHGQWVCRVLEGNRNGTHVDFYTERRFCEFLENIFIKELAE